ncbi:arsenate reductase ArsC [Litorivivens sp.]|uniref:arsenate reductase ArsC n=1 Tax=Litorivivens sp. TaxID=2020868 RepID=UPI0035675CA3
MKILYICTHNRCRSILSEAITHQRADGLLDARSAGSQPAGEVHPLSLRYLAQRGYRTEGLQSQSWDAFEDFAPDLVVTVCDSAAGEACPLYFGKSVKVHWGLSDPSKIEGSEAELEQAFMACIDEIERRVDQLIELAKGRPSPESLRAALAALGAH